MHAESPESLCLPFPLLCCLSEAQCWERCFLMRLWGAYPGSFRTRALVGLGVGHRLTPAPLLRTSRYLYAHSVMCLCLWPEGSPLTALWGSTLTETVALIQHSKNVR